jgi:hypothetical protein
MHARLVCIYRAVQCIIKLSDAVTNIGNQYDFVIELPSVYGDIDVYVLTTYPLEISPALHYRPSGCCGGGYVSCMLSSYTITSNDVLNVTIVPQIGENITSFQLESTTDILSINQTSTLVSVPLASSVVLTNYEFFFSSQSPSGSVGHSSMCGAIVFNCAPGLPNYGIRITSTMTLLDVQTTIVVESGAKLTLYSTQIKVFVRSGGTLILPAGVYANGVVVMEDTSSFSVLSCMRFCAVFRFASISLSCKDFYGAVVKGSSSSANTTSTIIDCKAGVTFGPAVSAQTSSYCVVPSSVTILCPGSYTCMSNFALHFACLTFSSSA